MKDVDILQWIVNVDMICCFLDKHNFVMLNLQTMCDLFWQKKIMTILKFYYA